MKAGKVDLVSSNINANTNLRDRYGGFQVLGDRMIVRKLPEREKTASGRLWLPDTRTDSSYKSHVAQVLAIGKGARAKKKKVSHFFPGSKQWGEASVDVPTKKRYRGALNDINIGDYVVLAHPYVCTEAIYLDSEHTDVNEEEFSGNDRIASGHVRVFIIDGFEVIGIVDPEGDSEDVLAGIMSGQISIGG